jgi:hypothetical protein
MALTPTLQSAVSGTFPAQYASKTSNVWANDQGDNVYVTAAAGDTLIAVAIGLKSIDPFDQLHGTNPVYGGGHAFGYLQGLNDFNAIPTISDSAVTSPPGGNNWVIVPSLSGAVLVDADYTVGAVPPVAPNPWQSCVWNLDGFYPCIYTWVVTNATAGSYNVNLNSCYENFSSSISPPVANEWVAGKPIFDGGVNFLVTKFTWDTGTTTAVDGTPTTAISHANPAVSGAITLGSTTDIGFVIGLQKSANGLGFGTLVASPPTLYSEVANGRLVGSEAHYLIQWGSPATSPWTPSFANPLGYETVLAAFALRRT